MAPLTTYRLRESELEWKQIDDEIVALDARRGDYLAIDGAALTLWPALVEGATRADLVDRLVREFGIDADRAGVDVDAFVADLLAKDLLAY
jgi:Coenzyme PQQ synthesis protein D (PqqD)